MLVGIPNVDFSEAPRFVRRAVNHIRSELRDSFKIIIHIIHENREPCSGMALATEAKENLNLAEAHRAKAGRLKGAAREAEMQRNLSRVFGPPASGSDEEKACELLRAFIRENQEET